jgi:hypothetical protein
LKRNVNNSPRPRRWQRELQLIISRVEEFAAHVQHHLEALRWHRQREILRAIVRRVEIGLE